MVLSRDDRVGEVFAETVNSPDPKHAGRPCDAEACPGWTMLDANDRTTMIVAGGDRLYQLRQDRGAERRAELRNRPFGMAATQPR